MNRKISLGIALGITLIMMFVSSSGAYFFIKNKYDTALEGMPEKLLRYEYFDEVAGVIEKNYYGSVSEETLRRALTQGYVDALDENAQYMTKEEYTRYKRESQGDMDGIGVACTKTSSGKIKITKVFEGSPAKNSGIKKGDIITAFDGIEVSGKNYDEMVSKLHDTLTQSVNIIYKRGKKETDVTIKKGYEAQSLTTGVYESIGYIDISEFYSETADKVSEALDTFLLSGIKGVVVDLRSNSSRNYENAVKTLDLFVPMTGEEKAAASVLDEKGSVVKSYTTAPGEINVPVCVLVSQSTAAAAELFADNIRSFSKGTVYGSTTAGDALVREAFELSDGSALLLCTGKIVPYSAESFENSGVVPDEITENTEKNDDFKEDELFLKAAASLLQ